MQDQDEVGSVLQEERDQNIMEDEEEDVRGGDNDDEDTDRHKDLTFRLAGLAEFDICFGGLGFSARRV